MHQKYKYQSNISETQSDEQMQYNFRARSIMRKINDPLKY